MRTSLKWIKDLVPGIEDLTPQEYLDAMTLSGSKGEYYVELDKNLENIVIGQILKIEKHPDADKLVICQVNVGQEEPVQIVTGAPNVFEGAVVPVVLAGGKVAGGHDGSTPPEEGIKIKKGKLRGVPSNGMMCSIEELGSSRDMYPDAPENGIYIFKNRDDIKPGDDAIKALDTSATITSSYKTRGNSYTVNAQGANITVNGETKADTFADIAYDTAVTVSADNAKAWAIDGTTVAVGSSYTFYVGSDVTITPVTDAVTDKPMTAIVSAAPATAGSYRVSFLASSYIPAGYTVIDRGFVYGKGATQDELTLEKVGTTIAATGAKVKSISVPTNKDTVNDFGLVYGVKNKDAAATAVAYVTVKSMADDNSVTTVYSTISQFNY